MAWDWTGIFHRFHLLDINEKKAVIQEVRAMMKIATWQHIWNASHNYYFHIASFAYSFFKGQSFRFYVIDNLLRYTLFYSLFIWQESEDMF